MCISRDFQRVLHARRHDLTMKQFYTYLHCKPDGTPFYVGKGCGKRAYSLGDRGQHHARIVAKHGIEIFIFNCESEHGAFRDEVQQIAQLRREGFSLVNRTDGGEGSSGNIHSEEIRAKMRGRRVSDEARAKISARMKGTAYHAGHKNSKDSRMRMSEAQKARTDLAGNSFGVANRGVPKPPRSKEHRERLSASRLGVSPWNKGLKGLEHSEETKAKLRGNRNASGVRTPEQKKKMSASHQGKPWSAERRAAYVRSLDKGEIK